MSDREPVDPEPVDPELVEGRRAFVCGWPIHHSRSPIIHGHWLRELGLPGSYERVAVQPETAGLFFGGLATSGWVGGNVTIPHKEAAFAAATRCDEAAETIGAVNTLWFERGRLVGGNTDAYGFTSNLDERLPGWRDATHALVLGAGGAARGVVHALLQAGVARVTVSNRTVRRAETLAESFGPVVRGIAQEAEAALLPTVDLLVNTRPATEGEPDPDLSALRDGSLVTDIVYVPLETPVLRAARRRGLRAADGLGMLLHQAVPGFERWFGRRPAVTAELRALVLADLPA